MDLQNCFKMPKSPSSHRANQIQLIDFDASKHILSPLKKNKLLNMLDNNFKHKQIIYSTRHINDIKFVKDMNKKVKENNLKASHYNMFGSRLITNIGIVNDTNYMFKTNSRLVQNLNNGTRGFNICNMIVNTYFVTIVSITLHEDIPGIVRCDKLRINEFNKIMRFVKKNTRMIKRKYFRGNLSKKYKHKIILLGCCYNDELLIDLDEIKEKYVTTTLFHFETIDDIAIKYKIDIKLLDGNIN